MSFDQAVVDLSAAVAQQLQTQLSALMAEAQASMGELEHQLAVERERREQVEQQLEALQQSQTALLEELELERQARASADQQVQSIHAAIAEQLEHFEAAWRQLGRQAQPSSGGAASTSGPTELGQP